MKKLKAYIAGPDVFYKDAEKRANFAKEICKLFNFEPLVPVDNEIVNSDLKKMSAEIYLKNIAMIDESDLIIANVTPFRGPSADVGTVFEIGYAAAQNKKIFAFSDDLREYVEKVNTNDTDKIENFGNFDNLMIAETLSCLEPTIEQAVKKAAEFYYENKIAANNRLKM